MKPICTIEPLEARSLLSVPADAAAELPSVRLLSRSVVTGGTGHTFHLVVTSRDLLRPDTIEDGDVLVRGPRGFAAEADVTRVVTSFDGHRQIVTCRVGAPGGSFDRSDNGVYRVFVDDGAAVGGFRVSARRTVPPPVLPLPTSATSGPLSVELHSVYAWCDHMPWVGPEPDREYLVLTTTLRNTSDRPLEVRLERAYWSFDENQLGQETDNISVMSPHGPPTGVKTVVLQPGESRVVKFRGNGVFPEDNHDRRLYIALQFVAGEHVVAVRNSGVVIRTD